MIDDPNMSLLKAMRRTLGLAPLLHFLPLAQKENPIAIIALMPYLPQSMAEAYRKLDKSNQRLQKQNQKSKKAEEKMETRDYLLEKLLQSEEERKKLQTIPPEIVSELHNIFSRVQQEHHHELSKSIVSHLRSFYYT